MTLKEQMAQRKEAKKQRQQNQVTEALRRHNLNQRKRGLQDYIPMTEWATSSYALYFDTFKAKLNTNTLLIHHLINEFPQLHRMTFWDTDYDLSGIRKIIEQVFDKYLMNDDIETVQAKGMDKVSIHYKQRELLLRFVELMCGIICKYKSRREFAYDNANMINNHELYCKLGNFTVNKFCDWEGVHEARKLIETRVYSKENYLKAKQTFN